MDPTYAALFGMELRVSLEFLQQHLHELSVVAPGCLADLVTIVGRCGLRCVGDEFLTGLVDLLLHRPDGTTPEIVSLVAELRSLILGEKSERPGKGVCHG